MRSWVSMRRKRRFSKALLLGLIALAVHAVRGRGSTDWEFVDAPDEPETTTTAPAAEAPATSRKPRAARAATVTVFTTLFFAGAAFTAGAGDQAAQLLEGEPAALEATAETTTETTETEPAPAEPAPAEPAPAEPAPAEPAP